MMRRDSSHDTVGIGVPESLLSRHRKEPIMHNDTRIAVDVAKWFEIASPIALARIVWRERLPRA